MIAKFHEVSDKCSKITTKEYSTSFSSAIRLLHQDLRHLFIIFMVLCGLPMRSWIHFMIMIKLRYLEEFKKETYDAIEQGNQSEPNTE